MRAVPVQPAGSQLKGDEPRPASGEVVAPTKTRGTSAYAVGTDGRGIVAFAASGRDGGGLPAADRRVYAWPTTTRGDRTTFGHRRYDDRPLVAAVSDTHGVFGTTRQRLDASGSGPGLAVGPDGRVLATWSAGQVESAILAPGAARFRKEFRTGPISDATPAPGFTGRGEPLLVAEDTATSWFAYGDDVRRASRGWAHCDRGRAPITSQATAAATPATSDRAGSTPSPRITSTSANTAAASTATTNARRTDLTA